MDKIYLFLDDFREPSDAADYTRNHLAATLYNSAKWVVVRDYSDFVQYIQDYGVPDVVSFDHDLAAEHYSGDIDPESYTEKTGYDAAKFLVDYCMEHKVDFPEWYVHSMNIQGAENISTFIRNYLKQK